MFNYDQANVVKAHEVVFSYNGSKHEYYINSIARNDETHLESDILARGQLMTSGYYSPDRM